MQPAPESRQCVQQALQVALTILVIEEARQPVVAPLHHVLGNAGEIGARQAGHGRSLLALRASVDQGIAQPRIGNCP
jgi:hypothetical protein